MASFLLAGLVGLGGGVVRDVLIGESPPAAFQRPGYLIPVLLATLVVYASRTMCTDFVERCCSSTP